MATRQDGPAARPANPPSQGRIPIPASVLGRVGGRILGPGKAGTLRGAPVRPSAYVAGELLVQSPPTATETSVGALNPNGSLALFSNGGDWVSCHRHGAAVVSSFPVTFDGALEPQRRTAFGEDIDPDDFMGGFGLWSGTSFAAPVLAAQLAGRMLKGGTLDATDARSAVMRGWAAITREIGWRRPGS
jgi:hypothetical protein